METLSNNIKEILSEDTKSTNITFHLIGTQVDAVYEMQCPWFRGSVCAIGTTWNETSGKPVLSNQTTMQCGQIWPIIGEVASGRVFYPQGYPIQSEIFF